LRAALQQPASRIAYVCSLIRHLEGPQSFLDLGAKIPSENMLFEVAYLIRAFGVEARQCALRLYRWPSR
jgi:hypothetical protein